MFRQIWCNIAAGTYRLRSSRCTAADVSKFRPSLQRPPCLNTVRGYASRRNDYNRFNRGPQSRFSQIGGLWASSPFFRIGVYSAAGCGGVFYITHIEDVPVTGRRRFNFISPETARQMGLEQYRQVLRQYRGRILPDWAPESQMARRVLDRLIPASGVDGEWELHVVRDEQTNAFVLPGNKVFVMTGILPICANDDGLATVLGHEIAHNVAQHAAERMSQLSLLSLAALAASVVFDQSGTLPRLVLELVFQRPGSRAQEAEADHIGLLMMAASCFDPAQALGFWKRMEAQEKFAPPQFLSTHPSNHQRLEKLQQWLPQAEVKREESRCGMTSSYANDFARTLGGGGRRSPF